MSKSITGQSMKQTHTITSILSADALFQFCHLSGRMPIRQNIVRNTFPQGNVWVCLRIKISGKNHSFCWEHALWFITNNCFCRLRVVSSTLTHDVHLELARLQTGRRRRLQLGAKTWCHDNSADWPDQWQDFKQRCVACENGFALKLTLLLWTYFSTKYLGFMSSHITNFQFRWSAEGQLGSFHYFNLWRRCTVNPEYFVRTQFSYPGLSDLSYAWNFHIVADRCGFSDLLCTFRMHFIFVRKPARTKYTKITCLRNILDLQYTPKRWRYSICHLFSSPIRVFNQI